MAHFHCQVNVGVKEGGKNRASAHYAYVTRTGEYEKLRSAEELVVCKSGNLPSWAQDNHALFWVASDEYERENGSVYREIEGALPRELTLDQQIEIVDNFIAEHLKNHAFTYAIHVKKASDGLDQPHVHLMFSERVLDGIERCPKTFFKRVAAGRKDKHGHVKVPDPSTGGCRKDSMQPKLLEFREDWAILLNNAYKEVGKHERVSHLSLKAQGIDRVPDRHVGPTRQAEKNTAIQEAKEAEERALQTIADFAVVRKKQIAVDMAIRQIKVKVRVVKSKAFAPGITYAKEYRQKIQELTYGQSSQWLAQYFKIERKDRTMIFKNKHAEVADRGTSMTAAAGNSDEIKAMLELASLKKWTEIQFRGSDDFKLRAMIATIKENKISVSATTNEDKELLKKAHFIVASGTGVSKSSISKPPKK